MPRHGTRTTRAAAAALALSAAVAAAGEAAPPAGARGAPALADFTRHARFVEAKLSPRGTYLAAIAVERGKRSLAIIDLASRKLASQVTPSGETMVGAFHWANDERAVVELLDQGDGELDQPVSRGEIYSVDARSGNGKLVFGYRAGERQTGSHVRRGTADRAWGFVLDTLRNDDRRILVESTWMDDKEDGFVTLHKLDVYTGVKTPAGRSPARAASFLTDEDGEPRIALARDEAMRSRAWHRDADGDWTELATLAGLSPSSAPVGFVAQDRILYVVDAEKEGFGLYAVSLADGTRRLLARNAVVPPSAYLRDPSTERILAVEFEPDLPVWEVIAPAHPLAKLLESLLASFPGEHVRIASTSLDQRKVVAHVYGDRNPGRFLLVDAATMSAQPVAETRPWIDAEAMAETSAFHIKASDGFRIHGYVTLPRERGPGAPPMIVLPHGGPHGVRDRWGFDPEVQLLASAGFAVLQVNYRGSGGYGSAYEEAGYRRWGDRVVQDVVDATRFAIRKGFADPQRICAFGASFGAYAAMQAAILAPDLFRCAVGYAGVYDLTRMSRADIADTRLGRGYLRTALGDDPAALRAASPAHNAARLKARVLLVHGDEDRRAPIDQAKRLRQALEESGNAPEWLVEKKEGHGFYDERARERMYARVVAFLQEATGAR